MRIKCSECGVLFDANANAKTCTPKCRSARSRRIARTIKRQADGKVYEGPEKELADRIHGVQPDIIKDLAREELAPVVRESITEDTMRAIQDLVGLTGSAVAALQEDLTSDNALLRQRAYKLVLQYTVGHPAVVRPDDADPNAQLVVQVNMPRPTSNTTSDMEAEVVEIRECEVCKQEKPVDEFVADSTRCQTCHDRLLAEAAPLLDQQPPDSA